MPHTKSSSRTNDGILLDVGCGGNKRGSTWVGIDQRKLPGVDIVHNLEVFPWPIRANSVLTAVVSHVWEHIKPWHTIQFMDELWRVCKPGAQAWFSMPYGVTRRFVQDPTHCNPSNETTWFYFDPAPDPRIAGYTPGIEVLWQIYKPKPWQITHLYWNEASDLEVILVKREEK